MMQRVPLSPAELVDQLAEKMRVASPNWNKNSEWTNALKASLRSLLETEGTKVTEVLYSDRESEKHEFLLDLVVWDRTEGKGEGVTLAVESEWYQHVDAIAEDFWKLLVVKAPIKLMIFACNKKPTKFTQEAVWAKLSECILLYRDHIQGERYVFMDYAPPPGRKAWWIEIPNTGRLDRLPVVNHIDLY